MIKKPYKILPLFNLKNIGIRNHLPIHKKNLFLNTYNSKMKNEININPNKSNKYINNLSELTAKTKHKNSQTVS
jgi:hypothetical protein